MAQELRLIPSTRVNKWHIETYTGNSRIGRDGGREETGIPRTCYAVPVPEIKQPQVQ